MNMRIPLDQITEPGLEISGDVQESWVLAAAVSLRDTPGQPKAAPRADEPPESAEVKLTLSRNGDHVDVFGQASVTIVRGCDRCGTSVRMSMAGDVDMHFNPPADSYEEAEHGLSADELDVGWHDGQAIDLCAVLTEQFTLWAPDVVRCGETGVSPIAADHRCELPTGAQEEGASKRNPFAGLRLPE